MQVAVYGSLRKGLHNHRLIKDSKFKGQFETDHKYHLLDLGSFPGLVKGGSTSVVMEVYKVNAETLRNLDSLEGYSPDRPVEKNFYIREKIDSPFGQISVYFLNRAEENYIGVNNVDTGDWADYYKTSNLIKEKV